jgi:ribosomal RNA assembly protein
MITGTIKIPKDRIPVLIGTRGGTKKRIEKIGKSKLEVDSDSGIVQIFQYEDAVLSMLTANVVRAIGRGFNPEKAEMLYDPDMQLVIISLRDFAKPGSRRIEEIKGRIIGKAGKTRKIIEELSSSFISVYGDTVSVIADHVSLSYSVEAIQMIIQGKRQRTVYQYLEKKFRDIKFKKLEESFD